MANRFQILVVLDYALAMPWEKGKPWKARPIVRAIPEVAFMSRGSEVQWLVRHLYPYHFPILHWEIYFRHGSPFRKLDELLRVSTKEQETVSGDAQHSGASESLVAEGEGEFKYGIRVIDPEKKAAVSDEDPLLIIR